MIDQANAIIRTNLNEIYIVDSAFKSLILIRSDRFRLKHRGWRMAFRLVAQIAKRGPQRGSRIVLDCEPYWIASR